MVITFRSFNKIEFPVFLLSSGDWEVSDGLVFCEGKVVDDRNQPGETLGIRRLQSPFTDLYPLKKALHAPNGLMKQSTPYFIDSAGKTFIYDKTMFVPLKYLEIKRVERKEVASLIWVKGHNAPFNVSRPPDSDMKWAGILHLHGVPWMLYEYSETKLKDTRRKV